jgi:hypothetical protein
MSKLGQPPQFAKTRMVKGPDLAVLPSLPFKEEEKKSMATSTSEPLGRSTPQKRGKGVEGEVGACGHSLSRPQKDGQRRGQGRSKASQTLRQRRYRERLRRCSSCIQPALSPRGLEWLVKVKAIPEDEAKLTGRKAREVWTLRVEEWIERQAWLDLG